MSTWSAKLAKIQLNISSVHNSIINVQLVPYWP